MAQGHWAQKPSLEHVKGSLHMVTRPGEYQAVDGAVYAIPVGFLTDGGSVPRPFWVLYPPFGEDDEPAFVLHDLLYHYAEQFPGDDQGHVSRGRADALLKEAARALEYRRSGAAVIWAAVRAGGWRTWNRYRKAARALATP